MGLIEFLTGWTRIDSKFIPKKVLKALDTKAGATASVRTRQRGYKRHIRDKNFVYRIVVKPESMGMGGVMTGLPEYYYKRDTKKQR